jgi:hypothetical protein
MLWDSLLLRLKSLIYEQCRRPRISIIKLTLVVYDGELKSWTEPVVIKIEGDDPRLLDCLTNAAQGSIVEIETTDAAPRPRGRPRSTPIP